MKILLAIDGSEHSEAAVGIIKTRPWPAGSTVRILSAVPHTLPPPPAPAWSGVALGYRELQEQLTRDAERLVAQAASSIGDRGLTIETEVRSGDPRALIVDEARDWSADLVLVGSRGLTGLKLWVLGSVSQHVVSHAPCSVEVVRPKEA